MLTMLLGMLLIAVVLLDVFLTALNVDGTSLYSRGVYRSVWWLWRHAGRLLPGMSGDLWLSLGAPFMIPLLIALWTVGLALGFALIYYGGYMSMGLVSSNVSASSFVTSFRLSFVSLSTIGFVEVGPSDAAYSTIVAAEALLGNVLLTLTITYFLGIHQVVFEHRKLVRQLRLRRTRNGAPSTPLSEYFTEEDHSVVGLDSWIRTIHDALITVHEGMRRYPIVYYFRPWRDAEGLPHTLRTLTDFVCALCWFLPGEHSARRSPVLKALAAAVADFVDDLQKNHVPVPKRTVVRPVPAKAFAVAHAGRHTTPDQWVNRFLEGQRATAAATGVAASTDSAEAYERYRAWLPYAVAFHDVIAAIERDLGYGERVRAAHASTWWRSLSRGPKERPQPLRLRSGVR